MTPSFEWGAVTARAETVIIVAGGPSLAGFNLDALAGLGVVIAVNEAAARLTFTDYAFTIDSGNLRTRVPFYHGAKVAAVPDNYLTPGARKRGWQVPPCRPCEITYLRRVMSDRMSDDAGVIHHASNSGSGALNFAYHLRPQRLGLLGFDHRQLDQYWHGPGRVADRPWEFDLDPYRNAAAQFDARGTAVMNGSPQSRLDMFTKTTPGGIIEWLSSTDDRSRKP